MRKKESSETQSMKATSRAKSKKKTSKVDPRKWIEWRYWELMPIRKRKAK